MKRKPSAWAWSAFKAAIALLLAGAALEGSGRLASADPPDSSPLPVEEEHEAPTPGEQHTPNTLYGQDDAIPLEDLPPDEQEGVLLAGERSQYPASVTAAYSAYAHKAAEDAAVQRAAYQSGTQGLDEVGVQP
jgi:hypothetical protein